MDPLYHSLSALSQLSVPTSGRCGASLTVLVIICAVAAMVAAMVFRWRIFMASSRYMIFLIIILALLIWLGRLSSKR